MFNTIAKCRQRLASWLMVTSLALASTPLPAADVQLPELGSASSAIISSQQEYELGQKVLKLYRSQMPTSSDPVIYRYLEELIDEIAKHSELRDKRFDLLVIDNPTINAFAVPGQIIGVHTGIFIATESEDQLASIIAHELAHLSQRHYARQVEAQQQATLPTLAGLVAGILLAAAGSGEAGMAAMAATQAAALDSRLRFSRLHEQEADRVGIQTLARAGRDPFAASEMFEVMLRQSRFRRIPPEFLSTHPVTESRIADARSRAMQMDSNQMGNDKTASLDFHLMAARAKLQHAPTLQHAVNQFRSELAGTSLSPEASRYGLALALIESGDTSAAKQELDSLLAERPNKLLYQLAQSQLDAANENYNSALNRLNRLLKQHPNDHAVNIQFAEIMMQAGEYDRCRQLLERYVDIRPSHDYAWYLLAEVQGLAGNIYGVHRARAEYFILNGLYEQAEKQLRNALRMVDSKSPEGERVGQRLIDVRELKEDTQL